MAEHYLNLCNDYDGWDYGECECGWVSPPCPGVEEVVGFYTDHVEAARIGGNP